MFRVHAAGARFQNGVDSGRWRLISICWPHSLVAVSAAPRPASPKEFFLRFELMNYTLSAPIGTPWDVDADCILPAANRPKGDRVTKAFRTDWENGRALYVPYDRVALEGHQNWIAEHPRYAWNPSRDITFYLTNVHELLNDEDYQGI